MSNIELLGLMRSIDYIESYVLECRKRVLETPFGKERKEIIRIEKAATTARVLRMQEIQNCCTHPIGVKVGFNVYCPICEKELASRSVITIEKEAGGHNIGFIREKIAEVLPLIPEVTPAQMAEYIDGELKTFSR